jgi:vacuolar-type H+-ATPase subunit F/Vma7
VALSLRVVSRPSLAAGFELAGIAVTRVADAAAAAEAMRQLAADTTVGMVLVDAVLYHALPRDLTTRLDRQALPVVAPFPSPTWDVEGEAEAYVLEILRQAIGYRVRPR